MDDSRANPAAKRLHVEFMSIPGQLSLALAGAFFIPEPQSAFGLALEAKAVSERALRSTTAVVNGETVLLPELLAPGGALNEVLTAVMANIQEEQARGLVSEESLSQYAVVLDKLASFQISRFAMDGLFNAATFLADKCIAELSNNKGGEDTTAILSSMRAFRDWTAGILDVLSKAWKQHRVKIDVDLTERERWCYITNNAPKVDDKCLTAVDSEEWAALFPVPDWAQVKDEDEMTGGSGGGISGTEVDDSNSDSDGTSGGGSSGMNDGDSSSDSDGSGGGTSGTEDGDSSSDSDGSGGGIRGMVAGDSSSDSDGSGNSGTDSGYISSDLFGLFKDDDGRWFLSPRVACWLYTKLKYYASDYRSLFCFLLPKIARPYLQNERWVESLSQCGKRLAARLKKGLLPRPNCTGEEVFLFMLLERYYPLYKELDDVDDEYRMIPASKCDDMRVFGGEVRWSPKVRVIYKANGDIDDSPHRLKCLAPAARYLHPAEWFNAFESEAFTNHVMISPERRAGKVEHAIAVLGKARQPLPEEILSNIVSHLDDSDIIRLTCCGTGRAV